MHLDFKEILSAWVSVAHPTDSQKSLAEKRLKVCNECPDVKDAAISGAEYCGNCGCYLKAKVYSYKEGACPKGKWDKVDKDYRNTKALKVLKESKKKALV